jgi:hypothetical protein
MSNKGKRRPQLKPVVGQPNSIDIEIANLEGALRCCETAISIVGAQQAPVKDSERFANAYGWLQQVRQNICGELNSCFQRKQAQQAPPPAPVKEAADAPAPTPSN